MIICLIISNDSFVFVQIVDIWNLRFWRGLSSRRQDPLWKYTSLVDEGNANKHTCIFCNKITNGGISRQKEYLIGTKKARKKYIALHQSSFRCDCRA